jgi:DNA-binding response OmpR family regulator
MQGQQAQKILIVDYDERALNVMDTFLANAGFGTTTAASGQEALDLLRSQEYDLLLVDDHLPDLPFGGLLQELDRLPFRPRVIMMESGPPRLWDAELYRSLGTSSAVNKWRPCEVLRAANEALCSQSRLAHSGAAHG